MIFVEPSNAGRPASAGLGFAGIPRRPFGLADPAGPRWFNGALAQLGERLLCKHQVIGSIPIGSTIFRAYIFSGMRIIRSAAPSRGIARKRAIFDIVNGF